MTPDQIKEAAIEAAAKAIFQCSYPNEEWLEAPSAVRHLCLKTARAAIRAYEAAMPKPVTIDRLMDARWHSVDVNSARVRLFGDKGIFDIPLPQPPVAAAIRAAGEE